MRFVIITQTSSSQAFLYKDISMSEVDLWEAGYMPIYIARVGDDELCR